MSSSDRVAASFGRIASSVKLGGNDLPRMPIVTIGLDPGKVTKAWRDATLNMEVLMGRINIGKIIKIETKERNGRIESEHAISD